MLPWPFEFDVDNHVEKYHIWEHEEAVSSFAAMNLEPLHKEDTSSAPVPLAAFLLCCPHACWRQLM